jgi:hypothetical protein
MAAGGCVRPYRLRRLADLYYLWPCSNRVTDGKQCAVNGKLRGERGRGRPYVYPPAGTFGPGAAFGQRLCDTG